MRVRSTEPGVQVYTGNYLDGSLRRRDGGPAYARRRLPPSLFTHLDRPLMNRGGAAAATWIVL